jgi:hypothetical protein
MGRVMAGVRVTIPGTAGIVESKAAQLAAAVQGHLNIATAPPEKKVGWPNAGASGMRFRFPNGQAQIRSVTGLLRATKWPLPTLCGSGKNRQRP